MHIQILIISLVLLSPTYSSENKNFNDFIAKLKFIILASKRGFDFIMFANGQGVWWKPKISSYL